MPEPAREWGVLANSVAPTRASFVVEAHHVWDLWGRPEQVKQVLYNRGSYIIHRLVYFVHDFIMQRFGEPKGSDAGHWPLAADWRNAPGGKSRLRFSAYL